MSSGRTAIHLNENSNEKIMKPVVILGSIVLLILFSQAFALAVSVSDRSSLLQVQTQPASSSQKNESQIDTSAKNSGNILQSSILTLKLAFMSDSRLFPYDLDCHVEEKTVELTGVVAIEEEKDLAAVITAHLIKEKDIVNHIEVRPSVSAAMQATRDSRLTELIKQRFANSQTLREAKFAIVTIRGVVSLSGQTRFQVIALEAAQTAREIPGIIAVNTHQIRIEAGND